jgi:hypothetical protein
MIADNAGIGSPPLSVFPAKVVDYTRFKFLLQVNLMVGNRQNTADVFRPMRLMLKVWCIPEAQVYAYYFAGGFFEQQGSHGGIHPSAQCHGDCSFGHRCAISISHGTKGDEIASSSRFIGASRSD